MSYLCLCCIHKYFNLYLYNNSVIAKILIKKKMIICFLPFLFEILYLTYYFIKYYLL
jgi:hypothetical protein